MSAVPGNVRALRPISILLASDDSPFAERLADAAHERKVALTCVPADTNIDVALVRYGSNIFVLDADDALPRGARSATTFAALHPDIPVVLVVEGASVRSVSGLLLLDKWRSTERLLGEIELAFLGFRP